MLKVRIRYTGRFSPLICALLPFAYWLWYFGIPLRVFPQLCLTGHLLNLEPILIWLIRIVPQIFNLSSTNFLAGAVGIEPAYSESKSDALPLSYAPIITRQNPLRRCHYNRLMDSWILGRVAIPLRQTDCLVTIIETRVTRD